MKKKKNQIIIFCYKILALNVRGFILTLTQFFKYIFTPCFLKFTGFCNGFCDCISVLFCVGFWLDVLVGRVGFIFGLLRGYFFGLCVVAVWGFVGSVGSCGFLWVNFWFLFLCWFVSWFLGYLLFVSMLVSLFEFLSVSGMVSKYCVGWLSLLVTLTWPSINMNTTKMRNLLR